MGYRGDIQIFRALAVILVVLFHLGVPGFSSGFLGVDIFFVISGYLMTKLHAKDDGAFDFYKRRARRLLPAYAATVAVTLGTAFFITVPSDFVQVGEQTFFAAALAANFGFALQNSYFSRFEFNPLLHLWSLAVECQFYLLFPFIIKVAVRWRFALAAIAFASLVLCLAFMLISPKYAFFMLPMRMWEFAIRMWVALRPSRTSRAGRWGAMALVAMAVIPLLPLNGNLRDLVFGHPALGAVMVCLATGAALMIGQPATLVNSAPGRVAQRLGNISYSLYLAHWPVLVLFHYQPFGGTTPHALNIIDAASVIAVTAVATALLYLVFERPGPRLFSARRAVLAAAVLSLAAAILMPLQLRQFDAIDGVTFAAMKDRSYNRCGKAFRILHPQQQLCETGAGPRGNILLIGDSFSDSIMEAFASTAKSHGFGSYFAVDNQPLITRGLDATWLAGEIRDLRPKAVYLHYTAEHLADGVLEAAKEAAAPSHIPVIVILPPPTYVQNVPQSIYLSRHGGPAMTATTLAEYHSATKDLAARSAALGFHLIDVAPAFCDPVCAVKDSAGRPLYFDRAHLTLVGAEWMAPWLGASIAKL